MGQTTCRQFCHPALPCLLAMLPPPSMKPFLWPRTSTRFRVTPMHGIVRFLLAILLPITSQAFAADDRIEPWEGKPFSADANALLKALEAKASPDDADVETLINNTTYQFDQQQRCH